MVHMKLAYAREAVHLFDTKEDCTKKGAIRRDPALDPTFGCSMFVCGKGGLNSSTFNSIPEKQ